MKTSQLTPYELAKVITDGKFNDIIGAYPHLAFLPEQQQAFAQFVVDSGEVRQVVWIEEAFKAAVGRHEAGHAIDETLVVTLPAGHYVSEAKTFIEMSVNRYLYAKGGELYTVVTPQKTMCNCPKNGFVDSFIAHEIIVSTRRLSDVRLYAPDVEQYLNKVGKSIAPKATSMLELHANIKETRSTLEDLMEATGMTTPEDAIDVAVSMVKQLELEHSILESSEVLSTFRTVLNQVYSGKLSFKNITQADLYLRQNCGFSTRQASVFSKEIFNQIEK